MLIDTHSHLYAEEFDADRSEVLARAEAAGISTILLPAIDKESYARQEELSASRPDLFRQMMGLHPTSVDDNYIEDLSLAQRLLMTDPDHYIGVGEVGLDFYWDTQYKEQQLEALDQQLNWAETLAKPVVLHLRNGKDGAAETDAYQAAFRLLEHHNLGKHAGIMHCFSGTPDDAQQAIAMGFMLGIGGVVTYKKSLLPHIVEVVPLEKIVLETDCPYLAPVPYRGTHNESAYLTAVAQKIADIKGTTVEQVGEVTTAAAKELFRL